MENENMNTIQKTCKICSLPIEADKTSRIYHSDCFKRHRAEYLKKYNQTIRQVRFRFQDLKEDMDNFKEGIIKEVLERLKK